MPKSTADKQAMRNLLKQSKPVILDGPEFVRLRESTKLAGIAPEVQSIGKELLTRVGGSGIAFPLATKQQQDAAGEIANSLKHGLRKFAKLMEPNKWLELKIYKEQSQLVMWYVERAKRKARATPAGRN